MQLFSTNRIGTQAASNSYSGPCVGGHQFAIQPTGNSRIPLSYPHRMNYRICIFILFLMYFI
jgi:hypothetical protein